ncbi:hypothetical protein J6590_038836 [Homalodisca vitripennis]|nr:hypothetical protein J6590_038836 [Homalodisca vitripennis]
MIRLNLDSIVLKKVLIFEVVDCEYNHKLSEYYMWIVLMLQTEMVVNHDERVGRRVAVGIWHGTVRYVGSVPPAQGLWLGVEWDDPSRGKHNGSHNGVHYFHTSHPTSGSFIRIEKADFGRSCVSAIQERYGSNELTLTVEELQELQRAMNAPLVEMVGFEEVKQLQSCFSSLEIVCLSKLQVSSAGEGLPSMCPRARHVDLASNLLNSWLQLAEITVNFPAMQFLNIRLLLSFLQSWSTCGVQYCFAMSRATKEDISSSGICFSATSKAVSSAYIMTWQNSCRYFGSMEDTSSIPEDGLDLKEDMVFVTSMTDTGRKVNDNRLEIPDNPENLTSAFNQMTHLVSGHMDYTWDQICECSKMWPQLERLQVPFNKITNISLPMYALENLIELDLEGNSIAQWEEINKLGTLKKLETLNLCDLGLTNISIPASQNLFPSLQCLMISSNNISKPQQGCATPSALTGVAGSELASPSSEGILRLLPYFFLTDFDRRRHLPPNLSSPEYPVTPDAALRFL